MSEYNIENITKLDRNFAPTFVDHHVLPGINVNGHCLISNIYIPNKVINGYIYYKLKSWLKLLNTDFTLKLTKNTDPGKYKYNGFGIGFDFCLECFFTDGSIEENVIISGTDPSLSVHMDNKNHDILILGEGPTQGLDDTTLTAEAKYLIKFKQPNKRFALCLHYNGSNSFLFVNATKIYQLKAK